MLRTFFRLALRFAAAVSLATFCDTAASCDLDNGSSSNLTGSADSGGDGLRLYVCVCVCVCVRARAFDVKH